MDELDEQKSEITTALAAAKLKKNLALTKEHILYFLKRFADLDYADLNCQKQLIKTFVNSVFVYEDAEKFLKNQEKYKKNLQNHLL